MKFLYQAKRHKLGETRYKKFCSKYFSVRPLFFSIRFIFLSQLMPLSFVPFFTSVLCCQPQRVGYRPLPSKGTIRIQANLWGVCGGGSGTGIDFSRAPGFFPASIISPIVPLHITLYSSCHKSSLISRWAPSLSQYMRTTAKYQYHKQRERDRGKAGSTYNKLSGSWPPEC